MSKKIAEKNNGSAAVVMKDKPAWRRKKTTSKQGHKGFVIILAILVLVLVSGVAWHIHDTKAKKKPVVARACTSTSNPSLMQAMTYLQPGKATQAKQTEQKILKLNNYQQDPNCLYILVVYDFSIDSIQLASSDLAQLKKVYDPKQGFDPLLGFASIDNLQAELTALEKAAQTPEK